MLERHPVDQRRVVRAESGKRRQVVGAGQNVDAVDLEQTGVLEHPAQVSTVRSDSGPGAGEALRANRKPSGLANRQGPHLRIVSGASDSAIWWTAV
jgi:hypothetical protein